MESVSGRPSITVPGKGLVLRDCVVTGTVVEASEITVFCAIDVVVKLAADVVTIVVVNVVCDTVLGTGAEVQPTIVKIVINSPILNNFFFILLAPV
jgi:hypothetical protein